MNLPTHADPIGALDGQTPLISARQLRLVQAGADIEASPGQLAFSTRIWAQLSLPYRNPGDVPRWTRQNNAIRMTLTPGPAGYPYGVLPRYLLTWMTTEAVRTGARELDAGPSLAGFLKGLGLDGSGATARRVTDQLHRLATASINIEDIRDNGESWSISGANFHVASRYSFTFSKDRSDQQDERGVVLSEELFNSILASPVPLRAEALRALSGSPMRLDLYTWLAYRMSTLRRPTTVSWGQLGAQFGAEYAKRRQFKAAFLRNLEQVRIIYPQARISVLEAGLRLTPSATHVVRQASSRRSSIPKAS